MSNGKDFLQCSSVLRKGQTMPEKNSEEKRLQERDPHTKAKCAPQTTQKWKPAVCRQGITPKETSTNARECARYILALNTGGNLWEHLLFFLALHRGSEERD